MKNNKILYGIIIILIAIVCLISGFILGNSDLFKKENNEEENKIIEKEITDTKEKEKLVKIVNLFNRLSIDGFDQTTIDIYNDLNLNDFEKMRLVFTNLENKLTEITIPKDQITINDEDIMLQYIRKQITVSEVESEYYNLFNEKISNHQDNEGCPTYSYDSTNSVYYYSAECGGSRGASGPVSYINRYTYNEKEAYVYINLGYIEYGEFIDGFTSYKIYKDLNKNNLYKTENNVDEILIDANIINASNYNDFSEYKYTFVKNDKGGYYFKSIEKTK